MQPSNPSRIKIYETIASDNLMRIVSLVPSATDILVELGAVDELAAVTYACGVVSKPVVVKPCISTENLSPEEVDRIVSSASANGEQLYLVDYGLIESLKPDLILAQGLCEVCGVTGDIVTEKLRSLAPIFTLNPHTVKEILDDILLVGKLVKREREAVELVAAISAKLEYVREYAAGLPLVRTAVLEWLHPPFCSGHWVPELVELAGGRDIGVAGKPSRRIRAEELLAHGPEKLVAAPCGYSLEKAALEVERFCGQNWVQQLPAYRCGEVYAVEADRYFSRHGPQIGDAALILGEILHPEVFREKAPQKTFRKMM
jgi:iron complex transport system substrate-binding protein